MATPPAASSSSEAVTNAIRVQVEARYSPEHSRSDPVQWFFLYTVTVSNVRDQARPNPGNLIDPGANSASFTFVGEPGIAGGMVLPRVVGAASTSNTTVTVTFNKAMGDGAEDPPNVAPPRAHSPRA